MTRNQQKEKAMPDQEAQTTHEADEDLQPREDEAADLQGGKRAAPGRGDSGPSRQRA